MHSGIRVAVENTNRHIECEQKRSSTILARLLRMNTLHTEVLKLYSHDPGACYSENASHGVHAYDDLEERISPTIGDRERRRWNQRSLSSQSSGSLYTAFAWWRDECKQIHRLLVSPWNRSRER